MRYVCILLFWKESRVIWLLVYIVTDLSVVCAFSMYSSDFRIASCSAWLFVHLLFSLYFKLLVCVHVLYMAMPAPNPCSDLMPSVNICCAVVLVIFPKSGYFTAGCSHCLTSMSWSNIASSLPLPLVSWYSWAASSTFVYGCQACVKLYIHIYKYIFMNIYIYYMYEYIYTYIYNVRVYIFIYTHILMSIYTHIWVYSYIW
jgi:hypothetical protein